jgi:hypothetical protein
MVASSEQIEGSRYALYRDDGADNGALIVTNIPILRRFLRTLT